MQENIKDGFIGAIGQTPLIRLRGLSRESGCDVLGKAEFLNPGGSVKDRAALGIILEAERNARLEPGGMIVEATAGNTGIGLALIARIRGYKTRIFIPDNQSREKKDMLRIAGAELREVPPKPFKDPGNYIRCAEREALRLNREQPGSAFWARQFDNRANRAMHLQTTGPEIYDQCGGKLDGFVCSVGTGGSLSGIGAALKDRDPNIRVALADPPGSALFGYYTRGVLEASGSSMTEGIGQGRITDNLRDAPIDSAFYVSDAQAMQEINRVLEQDGLCLGTSSGVNLAGARALAKELGPGKRIVTLLCDAGTKYTEKIYNPQFLRKRNLPLPDWLS